MRNCLKLLIILIGIMCVRVYAVDYNKGDVISVGESATITTDLFKYEGISYQASVSGKDFGRFNFQSITNVSTSSVPVSINILLFDAKKENIGFVTYCSDQDFGGEFAQKKLNGGASTNFYINVLSRYFVENKGPGDVLYYAVLDENSYCHVGGYTKYEGMTMEEISNGSKKTGEKPLISFDNEWVGKIRLFSFALVCLLFFGIIILIVKSITKKAQKDKKRILSKEAREDGQNVVTQYADGTVDAAPEQDIVTDATTDEEDDDPVVVADSSETSDLEDLFDGQTSFENVSLDDNTTVDDDDDDDSVVEEENPHGEELVMGDKESSSDTFSQEELFSPEDGQSEALNSFLANPEESMSTPDDIENNSEDGESDLMNLFK